ncbi:hypothetical protein GOP47_0002016, partial [Adiantum capillus-veneris]
MKCRPPTSAHPHHHLPPGTPPQPIRATFPVHDTLPSEFISRRPLWDRESYADAGEWMLLIRNLGVAAHTYLYLYSLNCLPSSSQFSASKLEYAMDSSAEAANSKNAANGVGRKLSKSNKGKNRVPLRALARVSLVATGVQFGWALQLSLLTPYVQVLGIPHAWASYVWLCGPISGMLVQPLVGHLSDNCESSWGRRRPFIVAGAVFVVLAVLIISFSADIGYILGDSLTSRPRAIVVFVLGFWLLDLANNTLQGPCRALLADFTGKDHRRSRRANAFFSLCMAFGNVLGYATGAYSSWYKVLPFTLTTACGKSCANLKSAFLIAIIILIATTLLSITAASEIPWSSATDSNKIDVNSATIPLLRRESSTELSQDEEEDESGEAQHEAFLWELCGTLKDLPKPMRYVLLITALTWFAWFPFILFDTDWMGREVFLGNPSSSDADLVKLYNAGVRAGSLGLMLNSVVLGITSLLLEPLCRRVGQRKVWAVANVIMSACFFGTIVVTIESRRTYTELGYLPLSILMSAIGIFAVLGIPLAVTYSVPYALTTMVTNTAGGGQGLSMGVLNLGVVVPQIVVSIGSGPWDELFGGGNMPAFVLAAVAALAGGILAAFLLPKPPPPADSQSSSL